MANDLRPPAPPPEGAKKKDEGEGGARKKDAVMGKWAGTFINLNKTF